MAAEHSLDRGRIELSQNTTDRRVGWCFPPLHAERIAQLGKVNIDEAVDRPIGVGASDDRQDREQHDVWQSIQLSLCPPRVFDFGQQVHKWTERRHGNRSATVKVASQRVRRRRVVGTYFLQSQGVLNRCVAFRTHPAHSPKKRALNSPGGQMLAVLKRVSNACINRHFHEVAVTLRYVTAIPAGCRSTMVALTKTLS